MSTNQTIRLYEITYLKSGASPQAISTKNPSAAKAQGSRIISATDAARSFSELLDRVSYRGETFIIERGGELVCEISHVRPLHFTGTDVPALLHSLPKPDPGYWRESKRVTTQDLTLPQSPWEH